jgi:hypothetical protein
MARIQTYSLDTTINTEDKVIGSDGAVGAENGKTKNFSVGELKGFINKDSTFLGWARYDSSESFASQTSASVSDGDFADLTMSLVANQKIDNFNLNDGKFTFTNDDINHVFAITIVFKASAANANQTHVDVNFLSGSSHYERLAKSVTFHKGNDVVQNFHEVFQLYVDQDLVSHGLEPVIGAHGGDIKVADAVYFIQKQQSN